MKLKTIKTEAEAMQAATQWMGDQPAMAVTIRDGSINEVRIGCMVITSTYGMNVSRMIEHEEGQRYRLIATAPGFPKQVTYHKLLSELRAKQREYGDGIETDDNNADEVDVLIDDSGNVVREVYKGEPLAAGATAPGDEIPF